MIGGEIRCGFVTGVDLVDVVGLEAVGGLVGLAVVVVVGLSVLGGGCSP